MTLEDKNSKYWETYGNHQRVKHAILREYLNGWFPKIGLSSARLLYVDSHAGRGRHDTGDDGSPIVALRAILEHDARERILARCEVVMSFIEGDEVNAARLQAEVDAITDIPDRVKVSVDTGDCHKLFARLQEYFAQSATHNLAPSFFLIDPYSTKGRDGGVQPARFSTVLAMWGAMTLGELASRRRSAPLPQWR